MYIIKRFSRGITVLRSTFRALRYRNFRLFIAGQGISLVGTWVQQVAMSWLVYRLTGSAFMLGLIGFLAQFPTFMLSPFAGVIIDRCDRRKLLIVTQVLFMAQAMALAFLTMTGMVALWHIVILSVFFGCVASFEIPARQSFVIEMVERKDMLGNAIALNSLSFNVARLIGPSVAGLAIAGFGEGVCFLLNGISFVAVLISLVMIHVAIHQHAKFENNIFEHIREGFRYTFGFMPIRSVLLSLSISSMVGMSYVVLLPIVAKDIFHGGPNTFGFLVASSGAGALVGTLYLAFRKSAIGLIRIISLSMAVFGIGLIFFAFSRLLPISFFILAIVGFGFMVNMASSNTIIQSIVDDDKRGRVMSFYTMAFMGMAPVGSFLGGALASCLGVMATIIIGGVVCIVTAFVFFSRIPLLRSQIYPIYRKHGLIPDQTPIINSSRC